VSEKKAMLHVELKGRMCNNMLQYMFARATADASGFGIVPFDVERGAGHSTDFIESFPNIRYDQDAGGRNLLGKGAYSCNDVFVQHYFFYQHIRPMAFCLFTPSMNHLSTVALSLGSNDVVVHVRDEFFMLANMSPPYAYYKTILDDLKAKGELGAMWIVTSPDLIKHESVTKLRAEFGAKVRRSR